LIRLRYESGLEHRGALLTAEANLAGADFEFSQATRTLESVQRQLTKAMGRKTFTPITVKGDFIVRDAAREKPDFEKIVQDNPSLLEAAAKRNAALFDVKSAYGDFAPTVSATAGAGRTEGRWPPENDQWDFGLNVSMPVFEGGLRTAQVAKAKSAYKQAQANERSAHDTAIVSLAEAWVALQDAVETVGVQQKTLEAAVERSKIAQAQYSTGFINFDSWIIIENDLVQAKKSYLESEANALIIEANWIRAKGETLEHA